VLAHHDLNRRQLLDLMARRLAVADQLLRRENMAAAAPSRPVINDLVDRPGRQQRPPLALMARLTAPPATGGVLAPPRRRVRRIRAGRLRRVARVAPQPPLELGDPPVLLLDAPL
jgi:hypothetical protein